MVGNIDRAQTISQVHHVEEALSLGSLESEVLLYDLVICFAVLSAMTTLRAVHFLDKHMLYLRMPNASSAPTKLPGQDQSLLTI